jgi:RNA polymerase-binding transcription factor DksA
MSDQIDGDDARRRLESERERVTGLISSLRDELGTAEAEQTGELASYDQHPADQGSETFEREKDLSILEGLEDELAEIEAALQRVDDGTYGIDEVTGEPIDTARLEAVPTARTNVSTGNTPRPETR